MPALTSSQARRRVAVRFAAYLLSEQGAAPLEFRALPGHCACGADNPRGLWISEGQHVRCPACAPRFRDCSRCQQPRPIGEFRINRTRMIVETYCRLCEQERQLAAYHLAQKTKQRDIPLTKK